MEEEIISPNTLINEANKSVEQEIGNEFYINQISK